MDEHRPTGAERELYTNTKLWEPNEKQLAKIRDLKLQAKECVLDILKRIGTPLTPSIEMNMDDFVDGAVTLDGFVDVYPFYDGSHFTSILDTVTDRMIRWDVCTVHHVPGVRYYPDGSGEPDSVDVISLYEHLTPTKPHMSVYPSSMQQACIDAVMTWLKMQVNSQFEAEAEDAMAKQMMEDEQIWD